MKKIFLACCAAALLGTACNNEKKPGDTNTDSTGQSATTKTEDKFVPIDTAAMTRNWMAYMQPGEMHKMMASWAGTWEGDISMWMADGAPPEITKGRAVQKAELGGRYLTAVNTGNMMGIPFEGRSTLAYDNSKKKFINTWIDNVGTGIMVLEGTWDAAAKTITFTGKCVNPAADDGREMDIRQTVQIVDDNTQIMEMYGPDPMTGKEYKSMSMKLIRKK